MSTPRYKSDESGWLWCEDCGCVVVRNYDDAHARFHSTLDAHAAAIARLITAHTSADVHDRWDIRERLRSASLDRLRPRASANDEAFADAYAVHDEGDH